jgi:hypothetical protein
MPRVPTCHLVIKLTHVPALLNVWTSPEKTNTHLCEAASSAAMQCIEVVCHWPNAHGAVLSVCEATVVIAPIAVPRTARVFERCVCNIKIAIELLLFFTQFISTFHLHLHTILC